MKQANKKGKSMITSNHQMRLTTNILYGISTVKLNHYITRNLPKVGKSLQYMIVDLTSVHPYIIFMKFDYII